MAEPRTDPEPLILYDGACGLCQDALAFVRSHAGEAFRYLPLDGGEAQRALAERGLSADGADTMFVLAGAGDREASALRKSAAVLFVAGRLGWPWKALALVAWLPLRWRDRAYDWVARNRYRLADRCPACAWAGPASRKRPSG